jgi:hypothetical protein
MDGMQRAWVLLAVGLGLASCGDDAEDVQDACVGSCGGDAAMDAATADAGKDASSGAMTFTCPMTGGSGALACTVPELNVDYFIDAGLTTLGPIPIELASTVVRPKGCCTEDNKCGVTEGTVAPGGTCFEQNQPGDKDGQCPDEVLTIDMNTMIPIPGCCKPTNECGLELAPLGIGCVERKEIISLLPGMGGLVDGGQFDGGVRGSLPCNYGNPPPDDDGGSDDAGN